VLVPAPPDVAAEADRLTGPPPLADGARIPLQHAAWAWLRQALRVLLEGRVVVIDYADVTSSLARRPWQEWLRTFAEHRPGGHPLERPGSQDITCVVAVDQLAAVKQPSVDLAQGAWLRSHGIDALVDAARATWWQRAGLGDLEAMMARSRVSEAEALTDPSGLGRFRVLEWEVR
jgi:SAM-dependent MidA family methyltransferase